MNTDMTLIGQQKEVYQYEDDISAEEENQSQGSWIPCKNEYSRRKKSPRCKKS